MTSTNTSKKLSITIPAGVYAALAANAREQGIPTARWARELIESTLDLPTVGQEWNYERDDLGHLAELEPVAMNAPMLEVRSPETDPDAYVLIEDGLIVAIYRDPAESLRALDARAAAWMTTHGWTPSDGAVWEYEGVPVAPNRDERAAVDVVFPTARAAIHGTDELTTWDRIDAGMFVERGLITASVGGHLRELAKQHNHRHEPAPALAFLLNLIGVRHSTDREWGTAVTRHVTTTPPVVNGSRVVLAPGDVLKHPAGALVYRDDSAWMVTVLRGLPTPITVAAEPDEHA